MQIDSIEIFHLALPLRQPRSTPQGSQDRLETVLVRVDGGGRSGWGEASPGNAPLAGAEWAGGVFATIRDWLAPALVGRIIDTAAGLDERLKLFRGNRYAKAALDAGWWDLKARGDGKPLGAALGGKREAIEVGVSFDQMATIDDLFSSLRRAFDEGFSRVELKLRPGWDLQMLNAVRHQFPTQTIHTDVEGALGLNHTELICRLDDFMLAMVEQPLPADDLVGHAMIQETIRTPVCLDEGVTTPEQAEMAIDLHSAKYINIKPGRVGGLTSAIAIHDACHHACIPCYVGATPQTALGARIGYALAAKENFSYPADYVDSDGLLAVDVAEPLSPVRDTGDGSLRIPLWSEPGLGIEPDTEVLEKYTLAHAKLKL